MSKLRCRIGLHKWPAWSDEDTFRIIRRFDDDGRLLDKPSIHGKGVIQRRKCPDCGLIEMRKTGVEIF